MLGTTSALKAEVLPEIRSLEPITAMPGMEMIVEGQNVTRLAYTAELVTSLLGEKMLSRVSWIDLKDPDNPSVYYDGRLTVYYGPLEDTSLKTALLRDAVSKLNADDSGTLTYAGGSNWTFSPD